MKRRMFFLLILIGSSSLFSQTVDTVFTDTIFSLANSPYTITNTRLHLWDNVSMTIEAGVSISFDNYSGILLSQGASVIGTGTTTDSITLRSAAGDSIWAGIWYQGLTSSPEGIVNLTFCTIQGAWQVAGGVSTVNLEDCLIFDGRNGISQAGYVSGQSSVSLNRCHLRDLSGYALNQVWSNAQISNCTFENLGTGMSFYGGFFSLGPTVSNSNFINVNTAIRGDLEGSYINGCDFIQNQTAIDLSNGIDVSISNCHFEQNNIGIDKWGNFSFLTNLGVSNSIFLNNTTALSYYGNGNSGSSNMGTRISGSDFVNNTTNIDFFSADTFDLKDNCFSAIDPAAIMATFVGQNGITPNAIITPFRIDCIPDLVYPGDTEHNQICDMSDLFQVGIHLGQTGPTRPNANLSWHGQDAPNWNDTIFNGRDLKHVDTDGDGSISLADTAAILQNLGLTHDNLRPTGIQSDGAPLYFDLNPSKIPADNILNVPIYLGTVDSTIVDIYGLSFQVDIDMTLIQNVSFIPTVSWLGTAASDLISIDQELSSGIAVGLVRTDQAMVSGFGQIGTLQIMLNPSILDTVTLSLDWTNVRAIDLNMTDLAISTSNSQVDLTTTLDFAALKGVNVFPNPSDGRIEIQSDYYLTGELLLVDLQGRTLYRTEFDGTNFEVRFPDLVRGIYLLEIRTSAERLVKKLQIIK